MGCTKMKSRRDELVPIFSFTTILFLAVICVVFPPEAYAGEKPESSKYYYVVREGDCLWSISEKFYRDPELWPYVWGQNADISNPHWIYPGESVNLPFAPEKSLPEAKIVEKRPVVPAKPLGEEKKGIQLFSELSETVLLIESEVVGAGHIVSSEGNKRLLSQNDEVFLDLSNEADNSVLSEYQVIRSEEKVMHPDTGEVVGRLYRILGLVEVTEASNFPIVSARIGASRDTMKVGDMLYKGFPLPGEVYCKKTSQDLDGTVIAAPRTTSEIAEMDVCFIDKGLLHGVEVGDSFWVMEKGEKVKRIDKKGMIALPDTRIALLVVIHTEKNTSTVLVADSRSSFDVGSSIVSRKE